MRKKENATGVVNLVKEGERGRERRKKELVHGKFVRGREGE